MIPFSIGVSINFFRIEGFCVQIFIEESLLPPYNNLFTVPKNTFYEKNIHCNIKRINCKDR